MSQEQSMVQTGEDFHLYSDVATSESEPENCPTTATPEVTPELLACIAKQVEFYFSDANLPTDKKLLKLIRKNSEGFVLIKLFANFRKVRTFTKDPDVITAALREYGKELALSPDQKSVKRIIPVPDYDIGEIQQRILVVENLGPGTTIDSVTEMFKEYGSIRVVRLCLSNSRSKLPSWLAAGCLQPMQQHAFVEYDEMEAVIRAAAAVYNSNDRTSRLVTNLAQVQKEASAPGSRRSSRNPSPSRNARSRRTSANGTPANTPNSRRTSLDHGARRGAPSAESSGQWGHIASPADKPPRSRRSSTDRLPPHTEPRHGSGGGSRLASGSGPDDSTWIHSSFLYSNGNKQQGGSMPGTPSASQNAEHAAGHHSSSRDHRQSRAEDALAAIMADAASNGVDADAVGSAASIAAALRRQLSIVNEGNEMERLMSAQLNDALLLEPEPVQRGSASKGPDKRRPPRDKAAAGAAAGGSAPNSARGDRRGSWAGPGSREKAGSDSTPHPQDDTASGSSVGAGDGFTPAKAAAKTGKPRRNSRREADAGAEAPDGAHGTGIEGGRASGGQGGNRNSDTRRQRRSIDIPGESRGPRRHSIDISSAAAYVAASASSAGSSSSSKKPAKKNYAAWAAATPEYRAEAAHLAVGSPPTHHFQQPHGEGHAGHLHAVHNSKGPDGTRGFAMGRGRRLEPPPS